MRQFETKASGVSADFGTGATRDSNKGKPRYDLVSPFAYKRLADVYARGGEIRGDRNWELGMPFSRLLESAERHLQQFKQGLTDEDHLAQCAWNLFAIMHFEELGRTDLQDLPEYQEAKARRITREAVDILVQRYGDGQGDKYDGPRL